MAATLVLDIVANASRAVASLRNVDQAAGRASTGAEKMRGKLGGMAKVAGIAAGAAALGGVVAVIKTGVGEQMDFVAGQAQLANGIKSTGNAAHVSVKGLESLASSVQSYSGQTDDSIVASEKLLLTFTNVTNAGGKAGGMFDQATKMTADMAAKMGGDASKYAVQLGKALNDPTKGISALTRVGVSFTEGQKKSIKTMQASGDTLGAQKVIMGELRKEFGGSAKAAGQTLPGQINRAKRSFEDMAQGIGASLMPVLQQLASSVMPLIGQAMKVLAPVISVLVKALGPLLAGVIKALMPIIAQLAPLIGQVLTTAVRALMPIIAALAPVLTSIVRIAGALLTPILKALAPVFKPIASALQILMSALLPIIPIVAQFASIVGNVLAQALKAVAPLLPSIAKLIVALLGVITPLLPIINLAARLIGAVLVAAIKLLVPVISLVIRVLTVFGRTVAGIIRGAVSAVSSGVRGMIGWFNSVKGSIGRALTGVYAAIVGPFLNAWRWISANASRMWTVFSGVAGHIGSALSGVFHAIIGPFESAWNWIERNVIRPIKSAWNGIANSVNAIHVSFSVPSNAITRAIHLAGKGFTFDPPNIPTLATGAYVTRATHAIVGEAGNEFVAPEPMLRRVIREELGGGGINLTINGALDPDAVARQLESILTRRARRVSGVHIRGVPVPT